MCILIHALKKKKLKYLFICETGCVEVRKQEVWFCLPRPSSEGENSVCQMQAYGFFIMQIIFFFSGAVHSIRTRLHWCSGIYSLVSVRVLEHLVLLQCQKSCGFALGLPVCLFLGLSLSSSVCFLKVCKLLKCAVAAAACLLLKGNKQDHHLSTW